MAKSTYPIHGMHCASCALKIERALKGVHGVSGAVVNFANESATVEFDTPASPEQFAKAVSDIGYHLEVGFPNGGSTSYDFGRHDHHRMLREAEIAELWKKFLVGAVCSIPVVALVFVKQTFAIPLAAALTAPVEFWAGAQFWRGAVLSLKSSGFLNKFNMDSLVAIGTGAAFVAGYFDVSSVVITLVLLGKYLEAKAKGRASEAIKRLMALQPSVAKNMKVGDEVIVRPGERVPTDGVVIDGESEVDESIATGESMPVPKKAGDSVIGATLNTIGAFTMRATKVGAETFLTRMIKLVEDAQGSKAPIQRFADRATSYFVPIVLGISIVTFVAWVAVGGGFPTALVNAVAVLVVACPCALGLATPTAVTVGVGKAAEQGIIIRNAEALELAGKIGVVVFDKTGTITLGKPGVVEISGDVLQIAASIEKFSEHPVAKAIVRKAKDDGIEFLNVLEFRADPGKGVYGKIEGIEYFVGRNLDGDIVVRRGDDALGTIEVRDELKSSSRDAVSRLVSIGLDVWMITGDNERTAREIADRVGIRNVLSRVLPDEKVSKVKELQKLGKKIAMVGDGINDAPALAQADVGIAIGTGTDTAIESAGITLASGDPTGVARAIGLSKRTYNNILQNLFWASIYNLVLIPVAAFGFLNPILAGGAMALSSVSVVANSLRLRRS